MNVQIQDDAQALGRAAAKYSAEILRGAIEERGEARLVLSTGQSQFETLNALATEDVDWTKVEMFHLDEYVNLPEQHPASFRRYLKERFTGQLSLKKAHFVNGDGDIEANIAHLTHEIRKAPIDLALIGIGENAHIAFNDPPADFNTRVAYMVVGLDDACKQQQVREGWSPSISEVPPQAVTMTVHQIMQSRVIVSAVPHANKAKAIQQTFENALTPDVPATALKTHPRMTLYLDRESASLIDPASLA